MRLTESQISEDEEHTNERHRDRDVPNSLFCEITPDFCENDQANPSKGPGDELCDDNKKGFSCDNLGENEIFILKR